jgi:hypothetical protein
MFLAAPPVLDLLLPSSNGRFQKKDALSRTALLWIICHDGRTTAAASWGRGEGTSAAIVGGKESEDEGGRRHSQEERNWGLRVPGAAGSFPLRRSLLSLSPRAFFPAKASSPNRDKPPSIIKRNGTTLTLLRVADADLTDSHSVTVITRCVGM